MFRITIINKDENTYGIKGFVTNSGPAFPLAPLDLLLEVVDLEDLKRRTRYNINGRKYIERCTICLVHK